MLLSAVYDKLSDERLVEEVAPIEGGRYRRTRPGSYTSANSSSRGTLCVCRRGDNDAPMACGLAKG